MLLMRASGKYRRVVQRFRRRVVMLNVWVGGVNWYVGDIRNFQIELGIFSYFIERRREEENEKRRAHIDHHISVRVSGMSERTIE